MFHDQLTRNLKEGERLVRVVRRDVLGSVRSITLVVLLVLADFFFLSWLLRYRSYGLIAFLAVLMTAVVLGFRAFVEWQLNAFVLTNERIIHVYQKGFFTRTVSEATYEKVTDVRSVIRGPLQTILNIGSVEVQTPGDGENLRIEGVREPAKVQAFLTNLLRTAHQRPPGLPLTAHELVAALTKAKEQLGEEGFRTTVESTDGEGRPAAKA